MTPKEAMRQYCQTFLRLVEAKPNSAVEHALERELDALAPLVHRKLKDSELERWRLQALAELQSYLMGADVELSGLHG